MGLAAFTHAPNPWGAMTVQRVSLDGTWKRSWSPGAWEGPSYTVLESLSPAECFGPTGDEVVEYLDWLMLTRPLGDVNAAYDVSLHLETRNVVKRAAQRARRLGAAEAVYDIARGLTFSGGRINRRLQFMDGGTTGRAEYAAALVVSDIVDADLLERLKRAAL